MSLILVNAYGAVIVQTDDDTEISLDKNESPESAPGPSGEEPLEHKPRPIVLGPKTRSPLPTSVQLVRVAGRPRPDGVRPYVIRLDRDIVGTGLSDEAAERVHEAIARCGGTLDLDVYIPPHHSVEVAMLSSHIASLGETGLSSLTLRVAGRLLED
ncbi:hypothetical protein [Piscinibacter sp.]|uniref:hypothetical protein n=1 Tax=Piscinibacter sp. TaxID=1903157 RepID=UPI002CF0F6C8|nr:hypothetical protein [Albitalea sp.]HUG23461.1 hypothetical protein [Albitalea sp.]